MFVCTLRVKSRIYHRFAIENLLFFVESGQWLQFLMDRCRQENVLLSIDEKAAGIDIQFHENVPRSRIVFWNGSDDRSVDATLALGDDITGSVHSAHTLSGFSGTLSTLTKTISSGKPSTHAAQLTVELNMENYEVSNAIDDPWLMAVKLFQKYIVNGSYFCINISGESRIVLYEQFGYDNVAIKRDEELMQTLKAKCGNNMDKLFHIFDTARYAAFRLMIYSVSRFENSEAYLENFIPSDSGSE